MQGVPATSRATQAARPRRGRKLPLLVLGALAAAGAILVVHETGSSNAQGHGPTTNHRRFHAGALCVHLHSAHAKTKHCLATAPSQHRVPVRNRAPLLPVSVREMQKYARGLAPVLDQSRGLFDSAASATSSSPGEDALAATCATYGQQILVLEQQADGVPHPYPFYTRVTGLHYTVMGIYHDMLGALTSCNDGASSQDYGAVSSALSDLQAADIQMRSMDDQVHGLETSRAG